jgi:hypothetical protein
MWEFSQRLLAHPCLPAVLALGAILVMWPALKIGLAADDLIQRAVALRPGQLPPRIHETGIPLDSGSLPAVLRDWFFHRTPECMALMKKYGVLPWWTPNDLSLGLWRPATAFTHWLDYQLFPDSPAVMHAHNLAWFAAVMFLVAVIYRKLMGTGWAAGLAALWFLLDGNTFFPVAFIANRGFVVSLFFGLMCLYEHHQWRSAQSRSGLVLSALFLALALLANEGGASTLAFILAYALVLEPGSLRRRALTVLPSILVIVLWRAIYTLCGFGIFHVGLYLDPATEPLQFGREVLPRAMVLLGGQLAHVAPDLLAAFSPSWQPLVTVFYGVPVVAGLLVFLPWVRRDKIAAFWFAVMMLAVIPAATVLPIGKNLGFVAVGAYGLLASFVGALLTRPSPLPAARSYRILAWIACGLLLLAHIPGAIAGRVLAAKGIPALFEVMNHLCRIGESAEVENKDVIVVNAPCATAVAPAPFYKAYHHQPLPRSIRTLVPGCTAFDVQRTDDRTLVLQSKAPDIFACDDVGPVHFAYAFRTCNRLIVAPRCTKGDRYELAHLKVEVLESGASGLPSRVACRFEASLDSADFNWLQFDWRTGSYQPFKVPAIGQCVILPGPP